MKTAADVQLLVSTLRQNNTGTCINATAIYSVLNQKKGKKIPYTSIVQQLISDFAQQDISVPATIPSLRSVFETYKQLTRHIDRKWDEICEFLNLEFKFTCHRQNSLPQQQLPVEVSSKLASLTLSEQVSVTTVTVTTPVKTRDDCLKCPAAKKLNFALKQTLSTEKKKAHQIKTSAASLKKTLKVKSNKQKIKRQDQKLKEFREKIRNYESQIACIQRKYKKADDSVAHLTKENKKLNKENEKLKKELAQLKDTCQSFSCDIKKQRSEVLEAEKCIEDLQCRLQEDKENKAEDTFLSKSGKMFCVDIRMCVYNELLCDVPVRHCGHLLNVFMNILHGKQLAHTPSTTTCAQMAYELGVLSTIMLMEFMLDHSGICLSWDATTVEGSHINEIHLTVNKVQCLVLDVRHLPGGKSSDYVTHIMSALTEAAETYAKYMDKPQGEVLSRLKASISATLTDRAAVNACVTRQLCEEMDSQLVQLNCNIHPLDGMARDVKAKLATLDKENNIQGSCFGSEGTAANLISALSVLRFKDGTGDPVGFKNFLRQNDLPIGTFVRYVGNRIHVLFHLAGLLVLHEAKLKDFLENQCTAAASIRSSILKDMKNNKIMVQVWALAVLGKIVTGPWMTRFYSSDMSNLEMGPLVRTCVAQLELWIDSPASLLQPTTDAFGKQLDPSTDTVVSSILAFEADEMAFQEAALTAVLKAALALLNRQLGSMVSGDFANPSEEILQKAASAPTHNMASERTLGSLDKMWRRAPNATAGFLNGKVKFKMNNCMKWLNSKDTEERQRLINFAVTEARADRVKKLSHQITVNKNIAERRRAVSAQRRKSKKTSLVKEIRNAMKNGNPNLCLTCKNSVRTRIQHFIRNPNSCVGALVIHTVNNVDWYARIHRRLPGFKLVLGYWMLGEAESNSVDFTVAAASLYADAALGDLVFL